MFNFWPFNTPRLRREKAARDEAKNQKLRNRLVGAPPEFTGTAAEYLAWLDRQAPGIAKAVPRQSDIGMPKPTRPAPPMPRVKPPREEPRSAQWRDENTPPPPDVWAAALARNETTMFGSRESEPAKIQGGGGTFDGGGSSGDWGRSSDSGSSSSSSDSSSSSSDSGSSSSSSSSD